MLGLDGLPFSTAIRLCREGRLPNLARIALTTEARSFQAELPELSPVNWTSFFTAAGPEEHGIYGFTSLDPHSYALRFADFTQIRVRTIFDRLGDRGLTSRVVNLPNTYPVKPLKGMLVAGFVAHEMSRAAFPPFLAHQLRAVGYMLEADTSRGGKDPQYLLTMLDAALRGRRAALDLLWPDLAWDLFVFVLTETDRLGHFLFPALEDLGHPQRDACLAFMRRWDDLIGHVLDRFDRLPEPKRLIALADHGFTSLTVEVDLNAWLRQQGYLTLDAPPDHELDCSNISPRSRAFALDPSRIYLHTPRFSRGRVSPAEAPGLRESVRAGLLDLQWHGEPVIAEVLRAEELYPDLREKSFPSALATHDPAIPDLVCVPRKGFSLRAKFDQTAIFGRADRQGCHTRDDAFFYDSKGTRPQRVRDVGRTVLEHFNALDSVILTAQ